MHGTASLGYTQPSEAPALKLGSTPRKSKTNPGLRFVVCSVQNPTPVPGRWACHIYGILHILYDISHIELALHTFTSCRYSACSTS